MQTLRSDFKPGFGSYYGERGEWLIVCTVHRESDTLARSNWQSIIDKLGGEQADKLEIERASHCFVGWIDYLIVNPDCVDIVNKAETILDKLDSHPVVDEEHWSELEHEEYYDSFKRDARSEFRRELRDCEVSERFIDLIDDSEPDSLIEWFESQIPSGDYMQDGYPRFSLAFERTTRDELAKLAKVCRMAKRKVSSI